MKKLIISESQAKRLGLIKEDVNDSKYTSDVTLEFSSYGATLKGHEINYIEKLKVRVSYDIDIEARSWGIKGIMLWNLTGPEEVEIEVDYYIDSDNTKVVSLPLKLDWSKAKLDKTIGGGIVCVGDAIDIELVNDSEGNLVVDEITVPIYGI